MLRFFLAFALATAVQAVHAAQVNGSVGTYPNDISFTCSLAGTTCTGIGEISGQDEGCSNRITSGTTVTLTGLDLSHVGSIQATFGFVNQQETITSHHADGTCSYAITGTSNVSFPMTGNWDGVRATFIVTGIKDGVPFSIPGTFTADSHVGTPVFPMTVTGSVDDRQVEIEVEIEFRPEDVGKAGSVYVFAVAPSNRVLGAKSAMRTGLVAKGAKDTKDTPIPCVIAQLSASGQLVGVAPSALIAAISGVLTSQGAAVKVADKVPTPNVAGSTFFVGYGPNATTMYNTGVNRSAVAIPSDIQCKPEAPQTGWWWNPQEDGRGYSIEVRANHYFMASFLYDASGRASWYVSTGEGATLDGSLITGRLLSAKGGQSLGGAYPGFPTIKDEGAITMAFNDFQHGTLVWAGGTVPIQRFNIVPNGLTKSALPGQPEAGWWWNPDESGRGFFLEWQGGVLDIAGYMYDD